MLKVRGKLDTEAIKKSTLQRRFKYFNPKHQSRGNLLVHCGDIDRYVTEVAAYSTAKDKGESVGALLCPLLCE